ncbi:MAG: hypothetical protein ABSE71_03025 [Candidatus Micrarchaeaceae archaeon]|jgi:hypothetical protein|nr:hypothetical protein [Candidatus Micrarchaeota archaeon]HII10053.1 hypothetical protein [Candidatus Micrarchaeota archaeon]
MESKKAQSAVEYLTTYGWAILIIGITLGALYSLGLFSPSSFISNQCIFPADFGCISNFFYANGLLAINLEQATPSAINITGIGCNAGGNPTNMTQYTGANQIFLPIGTNVTFSTNCYANGTIYSSQPGSLYKGYLLVNYTSLQTGFQHELVGRVVDKAS